MADPKQDTLKDLKTVTRNILNDRAEKTQRIRELNAALNDEREKSKQLKKKQEQVAQKLEKAEQELKQARKQLKALKQEQKKKKDK